MFNVGPLELMVLAVIGLIVLGPDRLPGLARDAARLLRQLRDMATGARQQLREELGPEFADVDLRNLNPRTALARAVFGDEVPDLAKYDPRRLNPGAAVRSVIMGDDDPGGPADPAPPISMTKSPATAANGGSANGGSANGGSANGARPRPRPRPAPTTNYDSDAT